MNVVAIVPASLLDHDGRETGVLAPLAGRPVLGHVLDRLALANKLDGIVVTTSDAPEDTAIAEYCAARGILCLAGPRDDLLGRLLFAVRAAGTKGAVMIDAASPLIDPAVVDHVVSLLQLTDGMLDWVGNTAAPTYPQGMEVDGFTAASLAEADRRCAEPVERRLGPAFLWRNSRIYRLLSVTAPEGQERPQVSFRIGGPEDLARIEAVLRHFDGRGDFSLADILAVHDARPD